MSSPRERILETASSLFHRQGYNSTGINQIIKEAKVAKASFYDHFTSKEKLCIAFLNARHEFWFQSLTAFIAPGSDSNSKVSLAFDFIIYMNEKESFRGCSFLNILSEISGDQESILSIIQSHKYDLRMFFKSIVEDQLTATHLYLLFESSIIESQLFKSNDLVNQSKIIANNLLIKNL